MTDKWQKVVAFLVVGYFCLSRSFAYLGIPPLHVFVGEIVLAYFLLFGPKVSTGRWPWVAMSAPPFRTLRRRFLMLLAYGVFQVALGTARGYSLFTAVRDLAFNYYPLYLFLGLWVGLCSPSFLPKLVRWLAWFNGVYGLLFILFLDRITWSIPGVSNEVVEVRVFGLPLGSAIALIGLFAFESELRSVWHLVAMNLFVLLGMQIRGEWLAFTIGLIAWGWMTRRIKRIAMAGAYLMLLFTFMYTIDLRLPGPETRLAGTISIRDLVGRALAPINLDAASEYTEDSQDALNTTLWRTVWWAEIWTSVHETPARALLGFGYGFPLGDLNPYLDGQFIRTPHNLFLYALGYTGWLGVALFVVFQAELGRWLWRTWKECHQPFGILFWIVTLVLACFTAFFETPYGAIPFYLTVGCAMAPSLVHGMEGRMVLQR